MAKIKTPMEQASLAMAADYLKQTADLLAGSAEPMLHMRAKALLQALLLVKDGK